MKRISTIEEMVQKIDKFYRVKKNMFLTIREGITEVLHELKQLCKDTEYTEGWAKSFEHQLGKALGSIILHSEYYKRCWFAIVEGKI